jgi:5-formyltetrahydrofolate cyclo-ligase
MIPADKHSLRTRLLARRDALSEAERVEMSRRITERVMSLVEFQRASTLLLFASFGTEVNTWPLMRKILQMGNRLLLPAVCRRSRCMHLRHVQDVYRDLQPGVWGIMEPTEHCVQMQPSELDFVLLPGVAFDTFGGRLGYGGGYYDRLLLQLAEQKPEAALVAVAFETQIVPKVPVGPTDLPVPTIVTEKRIITCVAAGPAAASEAGHEP